MPYPDELRPHEKKWVLKMYDELDNKFAEYMKEIGATPGEVCKGLFMTPYDWTIQTKGGPLVAKSYGEEIFTGFEYPQLARQLVDCNPHSGKWNFHAFWSQMAKKDAEAIPPSDLLKRFKVALSTILL